MAKSWRLALARVALLGGAIAACNAPEKGDTPDKRDEQTTQKRSALTTSLFEPYVAYPTGSRPEAVAIGDLDGDGRKDIALVTSFSFDAANDYTVHVFLQDSNGSLKPRVKYPVGQRSSSIDIGDVNGDGRADVVVGFSGNGATGIAVLLQNASGTLDPMVSYPTANSYSVKVGDFNGDGRMDVAGIIYGTAGDGLDLLLQTETGSLAAPVTYQVPHGGLDELDAGDIDGDGRTDLVVMSGMDGFPDVSVLLQTSDGVLDEPVSYSLSGNVDPSGVALGDTNGDGRSDIVVSYGDNAASSIARFLQNTEGTMDPAVSYPSLGSPSSVVVADVDGDGRKDALVLHGGQLGVYRQYPSGDFVNEQRYPITSASHFQQQGLAVGDINGDGRADAVIADSQSGLVVLRHVNDTSLALTVTAPVGGPFYVGVPLSVRWTAGDIVALTGFDVSASFNNGASYSPIAGCTGLPATANDCPWTPSGPAGSSTRVRVTAQAGAGQTASAETTFNLVAPSISVTPPQFGAYVGTTVAISWSHNLPATDTVRVELSRDGGGSYETLAAAVPINGNGAGFNTFNWVVTGPNTNTARVRVTANGSLAASGTSFSFVISTATVTVTAPAAGTTAFTSGLSIAWTSNVSHTATTVRIELSRDGGSTFETVAAAAPTTPSFGGTFISAPVPGPDTSNAVVRVTTNGSVTASGSSASFTLVNPTLTITNPPAAATFFVGASLSITWSTNLPASAKAMVEISRNGGSTFESIGFLAPNTGSFTWVVTGPTTAAAKVRVGLNGPAFVSATTGTFAIATPTLTVTSPAASVFVGTQTAITWTHNLPVTDTVRIEISRDGGAFTTIDAAAPNTGSYTWNVTGPSSLGRVRVTSNGAFVATGTGVPFSIVTPSLTVTAPAAGTTVFSSLLLFSVAWTSNVASATTVLIEFSRDGGATFQTLAAAAPSGPFGGTFNAGAPFGSETSNARVRVTTNGPVAASGTSGSFALLIPSLTVTGPAAGATLYAGTTQAITWSTNLPSASSVSIALSRDGGSTFETLAAAAPNIGSFAWVVTGPNATSALVRVAVSSPVSLTRNSGTFPIVTPSVTVTAPAGGSVVFDSWLSVAWTSTVASATSVLIELSRDGGATFQMVAAAAPSGPSGGVFSGSVFGPDTTNALVRVTTNGPLTASGTSASFAMLTPSLTVTGPATGAALYAGAPVTITWSTNLPAAFPVSIELSRDGGSTFEILAAAAPNTGSFAWTATGPDSSSVVVRVAASSPAGVSGNSGMFAIATPSLTVTGPAAGALAYVGTPVTIGWTHNLSESDPVAIELSRDGGVTFELLAAAAPNTGSFAWTATGPDTAEARVRVASTGALSATHVGAAFQLTTPTLAVTSPTAGGSWAIGTARAISWSGNLPAGTTVSVDLSRDGGTTWTSLASAEPASGSLDWTATGPATMTARVRVSANDGVAAVGTSGAFTIGDPALTVTSPAAAAKWTIGAAQTITWSTNLLPTATVKIELTRNGGSTYTTLASTAPNSGSFAWTATGSASTTAKVRVSANGFTASSTSGTFSIVNGSVTVTSPNTSVAWAVGTVHAITWNHNAGAGAQFKIEVSRNGFWSLITAAAPAAGATTGSYNWTVVGPRTNNARVRVTWNANTAAQDSSNVGFQIN